jgi:hypothetical protein
MPHNARRHTVARRVTAQPHLRYPSGCIANTVKTHKSGEGHSSACMAWAAGTTQTGEHTQTVSWTYQCEVNARIQGQHEGHSGVLHRPVRGPEAVGWGAVASQDALLHVVQGKYEGPDAVRHLGEPRNTNAQRRGRSHHRAQPHPDTHTPSSFTREPIHKQGIPTCPKNLTRLKAVSGKPTTTSPWITKALYRLMKKALRCCEFRVNKSTNCNTQQGCVRWEGEQTVEPHILPHGMWLQ